MDEKEDGRDEDAGKDNPYRYNAKELDQETGLYYYGARYYDPRTSVWTAVDPISTYDPVMNREHYLDGQHNTGVYDSGNLNVYGYTYQNPIKYVDPNGKQNIPGPIQGVGDGLARSVESGINSLSKTVETVAVVLTGPLLLVSDYLANRGGGFNFTTKQNNSGPGPDRKGDRDTESVDGDAIIQAASNQTGKGPLNKANTIKGGAEIVKTVGEGMGLGADIVDKANLVINEKDTTFTTQRAGEITTTVIDENQVSSKGKVYDVKVTVPMSKVDSVIKASQESIQNQSQQMENINENILNKS
ncbi:RHS repeat-associated core domain-containing protein [Aquimarina sp. U1-2]|uniref:RHS repeat-associated core domain-containing protein n=1 Tax=Aquimarina sp. U1-2 TaxID=2823141 RepID=UPI00352FF35B